MLFPLNPKKPRATIQSRTAAPSTSAPQASLPAPSAPAASNSVDAPHANTAHLLRSPERGPSTAEQAAPRTRLSPGSPVEDFCTRVLRPRIKTPEAVDTALVGDVLAAHPFLEDGAAIAAKLGHRDASELMNLLSAALDPTASVEARDARTAAVLERAAVLVRRTLTLDDGVPIEPFLAPVLRALAEHVRSSARGTVTAGRGQVPADGGPGPTAASAMARTDSARTRLLAELVLPDARKLFETLGAENAKVVTDLLELVTEVGRTPDEKRAALRDISGRLGPAVRALLEHIDEHKRADLFERMFERYAKLVAPTLGRLSSAEPARVAQNLQAVGKMLDRSVTHLKDPQNERELEAHLDVLRFFLEIELDQLVRLDPTNPAATRDALDRIGTDLAKFADIGVNAARILRTVSAQDLSPEVKAERVRSAFEDMTPSSSRWSRPRSRSSTPAKATTA